MSELVSELVSGKASVMPTPQCYKNRTTPLLDSNHHPPQVRAEKLKGKAIAFKYSYRY